MQAVKNLILWIVFCEILSSCASTGKLSKTDIEVIRGSKKKSGCIIVGQCYDFESKEKLAVGLFNVNGVIFEGNTGALIANVLKGKYTVKAGFIGKQWNSSKIELFKGDSVFIKFYLKDDQTPLN